MATRDDTVSLQQMRDHAREAIALTQGLSRDALDSNRVLCLALVQLAQIIGEAANRISPQTRQCQPQIPWREIIALRNRLIYGYDTINLDILWQILTADLPRLITALDSILATPPKPPAA